jgi:hypothetical protein
VEHLAAADAGVAFRFVLARLFFKRFCVFPNHSSMHGEERILTD